MVPCLKKKQNMHQLQTKDNIQLNCSMNLLCQELCVSLGQIEQIRSMASQHHFQPLSEAPVSVNNKEHEQ